MSETLVTWGHMHSVSSAYSSRYSELWHQPHWIAWLCSFFIVLSYAWGWLLSGERPDKGEMPT